MLGVSKAIYHRNGPMNYRETALPLQKISKRNVQQRSDPKNTDIVAEKKI